MSEDETKMLENSPMLRRVLDSLESVKTSLAEVEKKIDQQGYNTRPMWDRAFDEIEKVNRNVLNLSRKIEVFKRDMLNLRSSQIENEERLNRLEGESTITIPDSALN